MTVSTAAKITPEIKKNAQLKAKHAISVENQITWLLFVKQVIKSQVIRNGTERKKFTSPKSSMRATLKNPYMHAIGSVLSMAVINQNL